MPLQHVENLYKPMDLCEVLGYGKGEPGLKDLIKMCWETGMKNIRDLNRAARKREVAQLCLPQPATAEGCAIAAGGGKTLTKPDAPGCAAEAGAAAAEAGGSGAASGGAAAAALSAPAPAPPPAPESSTGPAAGGAAGHGAGPAAQAAASGAAAGGPGVDGRCSEDVDVNGGSGGAVKRAAEASPVEKPGARRPRADTVLPFSLDAIASGSADEPGASAARGAPTPVVPTPIMSAEAGRHGQSTSSSACTLVSAHCSCCME